MSKAVAKYHQNQVTFSLISTPIDYFQLKEDYFKPDFFVKKHLSKLNPGQYFTLPSNFNLDQKETVVFNFQVGQGKTTLCYDLIQQYEKKGYFVIVCSPFIKLVNKDYEEIKNRVEKRKSTGGITGIDQKVFKYDDVKTLSNWGDQMKDVAAHTRSVHVMTINCLLGNSGNSSYEQAFSKKDYLQDLIDVAKSKGKKIVLFVDEIHESISNFSPLLIPNLLKFKGLVNKVYIASATFTPPTIPIIKTFSLLTDRNIEIYETERVKNMNQADIHLHVCNVPIFPSIDFEEIIKNQIKDYQNKGKDINIITGTKALAEKLAESDIFSKVNKSKKDISGFSISEINLLTGDTEIGYQKGQNNIGTTFKTGINIAGSNDVLFVVLPNLPKNASVENYGIFSDSITSIIQSIGRLRNGGEIHLFVNDPESLIGTKQDYDQIFENKGFVTHLPINKLYEELKVKYQFSVKTMEAEINEMEGGILNTNNLAIDVQKKQFGFYYPNEHEYLLNNSQNFALKHDNFSYGRLLAPYMIWACIQEQIINGKLKSITYYDRLTYNLDQTNANSVFTSILSSYKGSLTNLGFRKSMNNIGNFLSEVQDQNGNIERIHYEIEGRPIKTSQIISRQSNLLKEVIKVTYEICSGLKFPDTKEEYINSCINEAKGLQGKQSIPLINAYSKLESVKTEFLSRIKQSSVQLEGKEYIPCDYANIIDDQFLEEIRNVVEDLKEHDFLLKNKAFSFMQGAMTKKTAFSMLSEFFLELDKTRKQHNSISFNQVKKLDPMGNISITGLL